MSYSPFASSRRPKGPAWVMDPKVPSHSQRDKGGSSSKIHQLHSPPKVLLPMSEVSVSSIDHPPPLSDELQLTGKLHDMLLASAKSPTASVASLKMSLDMLQSLRYALDQVGGEMEATTPPYHAVRSPILTPPVPPALPTLEELQRRSHRKISEKVARNNNNLEILAFLEDGIRSSEEAMNRPTPDRSTGRASRAPRPLEGLTGAPSPVRGREGYATLFFQRQQQRGKFMEKK